MDKLSEWAEKLVFEGTLEGKLHGPPMRGFPLNPEAKSSRAALHGDRTAAPTGISGLRLDEVPLRPERQLNFPSEKNTPKTSPHALLSDLDRARLMHSFANHELLAIEIMALMLLRFPECPPAFRWSIAQTIKDEQKHFLLYQKRLEELGFPFGSFGINYFLWDICAHCKTPMEYVTRMALTFEQANLDYALFYAKKFRDAGDEASAELMHTIFRDEITHVHSGLRWFELWRPQELDQWQAYVNALSPPLTPARAKGFEFNSEIRRKIGFSEAFIRELQFFQQSKGRPPDVWWFNPEAEAELENGLHSYQPTPIFEQMRVDFAVHLAFLAKKDDIVCVPHKPGPDFQRALQNLGFDPPEFVSIENLPQKLRGRKLGKFIPWGITQRSVSMAKKWGLDLTIPPYLPDVHRTVSKKSWAKNTLLRYLASKAPSDTPKNCALGGTIHSETEFHTVANRLLEEWDAIVVKADYSCSGRGQKKFSRPLTLSAQETGWIRKHLKNTGSLTLEPWLPKRADFSIQLEVGLLSPQPAPTNSLVHPQRTHPPTPEKSLEPTARSDSLHDLQSARKKSIRILGITRFLTDHRGQYKGHILGDLFDGLPPDFKRWYYEHQLNRELESVAEFVGQELLSLGYQGPAGIDVLFYDRGKTFGLHPLLEINTRFTMGRIALALTPLVSKKVPARWLHLNPAIIDQALAKSRRQRLPHTDSVCNELLYHLNENLVQQQSPFTLPLTEGAFSTSASLPGVPTRTSSFSILVVGESLRRFELLGL